MWKLNTLSDVERVLKELDDKEDSATDLIRYMNICRMSVALGLINDEVSWKRIHRVCMRLQRRYQSFDQMAMEYKRARLDWYDIDPSEFETHPDMKFYHEVHAWLKREIWPNVPFNMDISNFV